MMNALLSLFDKFDAIKDRLSCHYGVTFLSIERSKGQRNRGIKFMIMYNKESYSVAIYQYEGRPGWVMGQCHVRPENRTIHISGGRSSFKAALDDFVAFIRDERPGRAMPNQFEHAPPLPDTIDKMMELYDLMLESGLLRERDAQFITSLKERKQMTFSEAQLHYLDALVIMILRSLREEKEANRSPEY